MKDSDTKFFQPLWLRVGLTVAVGAWFLFETLYSHDQFWMVTTALAFAYCVWNFFIRYPKGSPGEPPKQP